MNVRTTRFGEIEVTDNMVIDFQNGLGGFPELKKFFMVSHNVHVRWMQSMDNPDIAFILMEPFEMIPEYAFKIDINAEQYLDIVDASTLITFVMLAVRDDGLTLSVTANLRTPVLINTENMKGAQLTIEDSDVPVRFSIEAEDLFLEAAA
jgi:flagellar assembly factor FliW